MTYTCPMHPEVKSDKQGNRLAWIDRRDFFEPHSRHGTMLEALLTKLEQAGELI